MTLEPAALPGVFRVLAEPVRDERGFFTRLWSAAEFARRGLFADFVEYSLAYNERAGTLRGLHYQDGAYAETKLVRCIRGRAYDVLVDVRPDSPAFGRWAAFQLDSREPVTLYVPPGVAHGYQTLADATEMEYAIAPAYEPAAARGVRYDDPALAIPWPLAEPIVSARDRALPVLRA